MKKMFLLMVIALNSIASFGQAGWEKIYQNEAATTFTQTLSKKYILAGAEYESMMQRWDVFQTDSLGIIEWDTSFYREAEGMPECIKATADSGYIIAGYYYTNPYLLKFNKYNQLQWESEFNTSYGEIYIKDVLNLNDNSYLCVGGAVYSNDNGLFITKLNENGDTLWTKNYAEFATGMSIIPSFDNGYYCLSNAGTLLKINDSGDTLWTKNILDNFASSSMIKTPDDYLLIAGNEFVEGQLIFLKVNQYGEEIWKKIYASNYFYNSCNSIATTNDNGFITSNYMETSQMNVDGLWVMKLDEAGDSVFSIYAPVKLEPKEIFQTEDGLYLFLANNMYGTPRLVKTDSTGDVITHIPKLQPSVETIYCYPNPFDDELNICLDKSLEKEGLINIYNVVGTLVYSQNISFDEKIDTRMLNNGIYFIELKIDDKIFTNKLIKE